jgi:hypothetical protein
MPTQSRGHGTQESPVDCDGCTKRVPQHGRQSHHQIPYLNILSLARLGNRRKRAKWLRRRYCLAGLIKLQDV